MTYLIVQTFVLLLIAGLLGLWLGWYLTRLSAASSRSALQARLDSSLAAQSGLREERDAAVVARDSAETERRLLSDELNRLRAEHDGDTADVERLQAELAECRGALAAAGDDVGADPAELDRLRAELDACQSALQASAAPAGVAAVEHEADTAAIASAAAAAASGAMGLMSGAAPAVDPNDDDSDDDLQQIKGIGPKIADILRELGVRRYAQIAAWSAQDVESINARLKFKGRIEREGWIPQARDLLAARDRD